MVAAFILAVPIDQYFISLPTNASVTGFAVISFLILAGTVLIATTILLMMQLIQSHLPFYVGFGFQNLIAARLDSWEKRFSLPFLLFGQQILRLTSLVVNLVRISYYQKYHQIRLLKVVSVVSYLQSLWLYLWFD